MYVFLFAFPEHTRIYSHKNKIRQFFASHRFSLLVVFRSVAVYLRRKPFSVVLPFPTHLNFSAVLEGRGRGKKERVQAENAGKIGLLSITVEYV
jgi:hypothetical protein